MRDKSIEKEEQLKLWGSYRGLRAARICKFSGLLPVSQGEKPFLLFPLSLASYRIIIKIIIIFFFPFIFFHQNHPNPPPYFLLFLFLSVAIQAFTGGRFW